MAIKGIENWPHWTSRLLTIASAPRTLANIRINLILPENGSMANIFDADSLNASSFISHSCLRKRAKKSIKQTMKTDFNMKWHLKVIQGQAFKGHWKTDKALYDGA